MSTETELISRNLCGIVDIGSNGIRFSISSKSEHHARIMPCVFKDRLGISLYELQFPYADSLEQIPIPLEIIHEVCNAIKRFKLICEDFGVQDNSVKIIATEALRIAINKDEFINLIKKNFNWQFILLDNQLETEITTYGLVSSFDHVDGLYLDLTGGNVQLSWIKCNNDKLGQIKYCQDPINLPYGASVLTRRLRSESKIDLFNEIKQNFINLINNDKFVIPNDLIENAQRNGGFNLLTRGGGLRGLGHLLLSQDKNYPIQTILNGTSIPFDEFETMTDYLFLKGKIPNNLNKNPNSKKIFKVSEKRANQLPAVALLLTALFDCLPKIRNIYFGEGGIREGLLYSHLPTEIRSQDPLIVASQPYAPLLSNKYYNLLITSLPIKQNSNYLTLNNNNNNDLNSNIPKIVWERVAPALCNLAFIHSSYPKELQPTAALHVATTGIISGCNGLSHLVRALIGIALCNRWGGNIPETEENYLQSLENLVLNNTNKLMARRILWWTKYIGTIMYVICGVHPGGNIRDDVFNFQITDKNLLSNDNVTNSNSHGNSAIINKKFKNLTIDEAMLSSSPILKENNNNNNTNNNSISANSNVDNMTGTTPLDDSITAPNSLINENELNCGQTNLANTTNNSNFGSSAKSILSNYHEYEVIVNIGKDDLKTSASVRARIIALQKKIRKLSRGSSERVKIRVELTH